ATLRAFWLNLGGKPFGFHVRATDLTGTSLTFDASAIFVKDTDPALMTAVASAYDSPAQPGDTVSKLAGQKMGLAPPSDANAGATTLEVESLRFRSGARAGTLVMQDALPASAPFYPRIERASVHLPAARALAAADGNGTVAIGYHQQYLAAGLGADDP